MINRRNFSATLALAGADQVTRDWETLVAAIKRGEISAAAS